MALGWALANGEEMVLRWWDVPAERLRKDSTNGEGWFQKPCVSQKQQGREERLGRAYCTPSPQRGGQGWHDCIWMHVGAWAERLWAAVPTEEQSGKAASPSPSCGSGQGR